MTTSDTGDRSLGAGRTCFVISPIGDKLAPAGSEGRLRYENALQMWENVFEPAAEHFGMTVIRADRISTPGEIPEQIFTLLRDADVVVADLTRGNANVMYELGLRHSRSAVTIQVGEYERLPFDVNTIRTIQFRRSEGGLIDARNSLIEMLGSALRGEASQLTPTRVWLTPGSSGALVESAIAASASEPEQVDDDFDPGTGVVEMLADGEAAIQSLGGIMEGATAALQEIGEATRLAAARNQQSDASGLGFAGRLNVAKELSARLEAPTTRLEDRAGEFLGAAELANETILYLIGRVSGGHEPKDAFLQLFSAVQSLSEVSSSNSVSTQEFRETNRDTAKLSSTLRPVLKRIDLALLRFLRGNEIISSWAESIAELDG